MAQQIKLLGRVFLSGEIIAVSGMHIGGSPGGLAVGGVDLPVIRDLAFWSSIHPRVVVKRENEIAQRKIFWSSPKPSNW